VIEGSQLSSSLVSALSEVFSQEEASLKLDFKEERPIFIKNSGNY